MRWLSVCKCLPLATADFSGSAFSQLLLCSLRRNHRFQPVSPMQTKPHLQAMRYTPGGPVINEKHNKSNKNINIVVSYSIQNCKMQKYLR